VADSVDEPRGVDVRGPHHRDAGAGPLSGLGDVPVAAPPQPVLVGRPLGVPRAWCHRHDALGRNGEHRTATGATPGIGKPLRAFSGISAQDDSALAVAYGNDTR